MRLFCLVPVVSAFASLLTLLDARVKPIFFSNLADQFWPLRPQEFPGTFLAAEP